MLAYILRKVSIYAIELLSMELKRKEDGLRAYGASCGCQLFTSCGLPCACRLEKLENKGSFHTCRAWRFLSNASPKPTMDSEQNRARSRLAYIIQGSDRHVRNAYVSCPRP
ncbi:hypothetical protein HanPSC8_Chr04g0144241 [Helianthus annuus]|nr:hypothetical protein HanPSC8_Chr04g0144241 [Helianthus annuus]